LGAEGRDAQDLLYFELLLELLHLEPCLHVGWVDDYVASKGGVLCLDFVHESMDKRVEIVFLGSSDLGLSHE